MTQFSETSHLLATNPDKLSFRGLAPEANRGSSEAFSSLQRINQKYRLIDVSIAGRISQWRVRWALPQAKDSMSAVLFDEKLYTIGGRTEFDENFWYQH